MPSLNSLYCLYIVIVICLISLNQFSDMLSAFTSARAIDNI